MNTRLMRGALLSTCFGGIGNILRKKSLEICKSRKDTSMYVFSLFGSIGALLIVLFYFFSGNITLTDLAIPWQYILLITGGLAVAVIYRPISQRLNQEEKLATLIPFSNLNKIFSLGISFYLFQDVSLTSLLISLCAVCVIIGFSIDIKHFSFPKNFKDILIVESLVSVRYIIMSRCIIQLSDKIFYVYDVLIYIIIMALIIGKTHTQNQLTQFSGSFYKNRLGASLIGGAATVISLYLIAEIGATTVLLLGFLQVAIELIIAYFYLKEVPSKKDIILTIIVSLLVATGFYFK